MCVLIVLSQGIQNKRHGIFLFYEPIDISWMNFEYFVDDIYVAIINGIQLIKSINIVNAVVNGSFSPYFRRRLINKNACVSGAWKIPNLFMNYTIKTKQKLIFRVTIVFIFVNINMVSFEWIDELPKSKLIANPNNNYWLC